MKILEVIFSSFFLILTLSSALHFLKKIKCRAESIEIATLVRIKDLAQKNAMTELTLNSSCYGFYRTDESQITFGLDQQIVNFKKFKNTKL